MSHSGSSRQINKSQSTAILDHPGNYYRMTNTMRNSSLSSDEAPEDLKAVIMSSSLSLPAVEKEL